jgi:hypothetical protein
MHTLLNLLLIGVVLGAGLTLGTLFAYQTLDMLSTLAARLLIKIFRLRR